MGKEIEKKFLIVNDDWRLLGKGESYCQGYLNSEKGRTVRVRTVNDRGILTIKGPSVGGTRLEYEYDIAVDEAREMLNELCCKPLIEKTRYKIPFAGFIWEVDEFKGENDGLLFAEIELEYEGQKFKKPLWIGREVTDDSRYYNANLVKNPFSNWKK
ncbi:MAG: CYTH domain-containing protein [Desulforhopalus sp.]